MKKSIIKKIKQCFGKASMFFKEDKIKECENCQFKRRCLLEINGGGIQWKKEHAAKSGVES